MTKINHLISCSYNICSVGALRMYKTLNNYSCLKNHVILFTDDICIKFGKYETYSEKEIVLFKKLIPKVIFGIGDTMHNVFFRFVVFRRVTLSS